MIDTQGGVNDSRNGGESKPRIPKPSEYMRSTRPELFSDTVETAKPLLERSQLEYYLETLTSRKQEFAFEHFCCRLAEVEICPNLKPQTGPVGGGDSKTDSSTYPVADVLIERCYWGSPNPPTKEAWAFAFSCMKQWRRKARADVEKIAGLKKDFSTVYFISSQFVRDKSREELENELAEKYGFSVHILDRSWILDIVFSHRREELAIESLGIQVARTKENRPGPRDTERQAELDKLLGRLREPFEHYANDYAVAADYLQAAKLARGLERPRHEVAGLYQQARQISRKNGHSPQIIRCAYEHAWADNWWYNDASTAIEVYSEIEPLLSEIADSDDVEMFANLQSLMWQVVFREEVNSEDLNLREREDNLRNKLQELSEDTLRPNNALYAETMLAFLDLHPWNREAPAEAITRLADCFRRSRGLATYPLKRFTDTVMGMSEFIGSLAGFEELFNTMRAVLSEREGEISEAQLLLQRGEQHLHADRPKKALRLLGQARTKAAKEEILETSVRAANLAANSYLRLGLVWAARMEALVAANLSCQIVDGVFQSAYHGSQATRLLAWIELSQGRLAPFLRWMGIATSCSDQLVDSGFDLSQFKGSYQTLETALCDRLMLLDQHTATELVSLADTLREYGLPMARFVLLFTAGRSSDIKDEFIAAFEEDVEWMHDYFRQWKEWIDSAGSGVKPFSGLRDDVTSLSTEIMDVKYVVESCTDFGAIAFSENLLGVIEAMLALANWENLAFIVDEVRIKVDVHSDGKDQPEPKISTLSGGEVLELNWRSDIADRLALADRQKIGEYLMQTCMFVLQYATIDPLEDLESEIDQWRKDGAFDRALGTSPTIHSVADLIGKDCYDLENCLTAASSEA